MLFSDSIEKLAPIKVDWKGNVTGSTKHAFTEQRVLRVCLKRLSDSQVDEIQNKRFKMMPELKPEPESEPEPEEPSTGDSAGKRWVPFGEVF